MLKVAYSNVKELDLKKGYNLVSLKRKNKIDRFKFEKDKKLSCGAGLLLLKMLKDEGITNPDIKLDKYKKPYLANYPDINFNLSHSKEFIACTISDSTVGIDIEYTDYKIDLNIAKNFFFNDEYKAIINSENPTDKFFEYWVLKESYMKYTGLGFNLDLDSFCIDINQDINLKIENKIKNEIKFSLFTIEEYKLAIASKYKVKNLKKIDINSLLAI